jgi:molybdate/tungstate transport system permease protein
VTWAANLAAGEQAAGEQITGEHATGEQWAARRQATTGRSVNNALSLVAAAVIWAALLSPVITAAARMSPGATARALTGPGDLGPLLTSLESAAIALAVLLACTPLAWLLARGRLPWPHVWEAGIVLVLALPPLVTGLALMLMAGPRTWLGTALGWVHASAFNTALALVVAAVSESAPYYLLGARAAFASVGPRLEEQAGLLGDGRLRVFRRVTLPLAAPGLALSLSVAWARAVGAFGAVVVVAFHPFGLPTRIYTTLRETGPAAALPYALVLLVVALPPPLLACAWSARAARRRRG